ncbi:hypothetical protein GP486_003956 [Trichoglossum hirsutum]|uniref:Mg2+ transporter protein n=1 Tax=Trichoglossum hirsutum TaxID=265104 RepID=A0A9P8LC25_9PEZI|nr:hypothetical protein GP486_003956 [Trichoglossum hirsutum]
MEGLTQMLQSPYESSGDLLGRMLIVEDLTADVIELLGSSLEIDPLFFATHLRLALVDPPVRDTFFMDGREQQRARTPVPLRSEQFQGGYDAFPFTKLSLNDGSHSPPRYSLFDDLIYYWTEELPSVFDPRAPTLLSLSYYPLKIIVAEWMNFANLMLYTIENLEYSIEDLSTTLLGHQRLESDLARLQSWRRRALDSSDKMTSLVRAVKSLSPEPPYLETWESLFGDIGHILNRTDMYIRRFDGLIPVFSSYVQLVESRRSIIETKSITRLTYLALVFVPLTFVSSLFSMSGDVLPGKKNFWIYFAVAIPLTISRFTGHGDL